MSAQSIAKEAHYLRAVEIASDLFVRAGYCVRTKERCCKKVKDCEKCVKVFLLSKAREELNSVMINNNLEALKNVKKHNANE